jgi:DNA-binding PadR family transcriptional regulator
MANRPSRDRSGDVTRIALLGALSRRPMHGYDVKTTLAAWSMDWWADIQSGSIYAGLKKLEQDGLIEIVETSRNGNRPERRVFQITELGKREFVRMLREAWLSITRFSRPIDLAVSFYDVLGRGEIVELLEQRIVHLTGMAQLFDPAHIGTMASDAQEAVVIDLRDHELRLINAEIEWTKQLLERISSDVYPKTYGTRRGGARAEDATG